MEQTKTIRQYEIEDKEFLKKLGLNGKIISLMNCLGTTRIRIEGEY